MDDALLLGIDVGTTNCKALLFTPQGQISASASIPTPTDHPRPEWTEHDPEALWQAVVATIRQVLVGIDPTRVKGLAVTSVGEAGVLLDNADRPLAPIVAWHDARSAPQQRRWLRRIDQQRVDAITGMPVKPIFTLFKLQWLRETNPEAYHAAVSWLHESDYIAFKLSGERATDYSMASRTLLLDLRQRCWSQEILAAAEINPALLPVLRASGTLLGRVTPAAAALTGLATGTAVAVGGHDHIAGAFATGVVQAGQCLDSLGTAEATFLALDHIPPADTATRTGCTFGAHVAHDRVFVLDGLLSGGGAVNWARQLLTPGEQRFDHLEQMAAAAPPLSRGALFLPRLAAGEYGGFAGLTMAIGPNELARAVYEGLAFGWRQLLEKVEQATGQRASQIKVIGGGMRSQIWMRVKSNVLGRPLQILAVEESVALGAAMLGGIAAGVYRNEAEALASVQLDSQTLLPDPEQIDLYDRRYKEAFLQLAPALGAIHTAGFPEG